MSGNRAPRPRGRAHSLILVASLLVAACSQPTADRDLDPVARSEGSLEGGRFADADLERGELLGLSCRACHTFGPGEDHLLGPNLNGLFGRPAASAPGFEYSAALRAAGFVWTPDELDSWLAEPDGFLPGNNMPFAGFNSAADRNDLLAYLLRVTVEGSP